LFPDPVEGTRAYRFPRRPTVAVLIKNRIAPITIERDSPVGISEVFGGDAGKASGSSSDRLPPFSTTDATTVGFIAWLDFIAALLR